MYQRSAAQPTTTATRTSAVSFWLVRNTRSRMNSMHGRSAARNASTDSKSCDRERAIWPLAVRDTAAAADAAFSLSRDVRPFTHSSSAPAASDRFTAVRRSCCSALSVDTSPWKRRATLSRCAFSSLRRARPALISAVTVCSSFCSCSLRACRESIWLSSFSSSSVTGASAVSYCVRSSSMRLRTVAWRARASSDAGGDSAFTFDTSAGLATPSLPSAAVVVMTDAAEHFDTSARAMSKHRSRRRKRRPMSDDAAGSLLRRAAAAARARSASPDAPGVAPLPRLRRNAAMAADICAATAPMASSRVVAYSTSVAATSRPANVVMAVRRWDRMSDTTLSLPSSVARSSLRSSCSTVDKLGWRSTFSRIVSSAPHVKKVDTWSRDARRRHARSATNTCCTSGCAATVRSISAVLRGSSP